MKKTMIGIALALLAFAGCRQKDVREFTVEVPALEQAQKLERNIRAELAACNSSDVTFSPTHVSMLVKVHPTNNKDHVKNAVLRALVRAGCDGVKPTSIQMSPYPVKVIKETGVEEYQLSAEYKTLSGALACSGIESTEFDAENSCVRIRYDSMQIAKKNIEMAIAAAGYTANGVTPESIGAKSRETPNDK